MLASNYVLNFPETLNLSVGGSAVHYTHLGPQASVPSVAMTLNGTTINSGADVEVEIAIVGGAVLYTVFLSTGAVAGTSQTTSDSSAVIPTGAVLSATVTVPATVAAGTGTITLLIFNG